VRGRDEVGFFLWNEARTGEKRSGCFGREDADGFCSFERERERDVCNPPLFSSTHLDVTWVEQNTFQISFSAVFFKFFKFYFFNTWERSGGVLLLLYG